MTGVTKKLALLLPLLAGTCWGCCGGFVLFSGNRRFSTKFKSFGRRRRCGGLVLLDGNRKIDTN